MQRTIDTALSPSGSPTIQHSKTASSTRFSGILVRRSTTTTSNETDAARRKQSTTSSASSPPRAGESFVRSKGATPKFVIPDSDKVFNFKCSGELGGDSIIAGKRVEWKAKFDRPIEELLYPSLQRFDIAGYEKKVAQSQAQTKRISEPIELQSGTSAKSPSRVRLQSHHETEPIRLEPIPKHLLPASEDVMFVHAPQWSVKVSESSRPGTAGTTITDDGNLVYDSLSEEIDIEGEKFLRAKMKASITEQEDDRKRKAQIARGVLVGLNRSSSSDIQYTQQPGEYDALERANQLYASLLKQSEEKEQLAHMLRRNSKETIYESEIAGFNRLKREVARSIPSDQKHLLDGMLYYKNGHANHQAQLNARRGTEETHMKTLKGRDDRRKTSFDSSLMTRLQKRRQSVATTASTVSASIQMVREEDTVQPLHEERFTRVQRALDGRNVGLQQSHLSAAMQHVYSATKDAQNNVYRSHAVSRRAGVMFVENEEHTPMQVEHESVVAQNNIRHAQDTLLLHQLDSGVIPERFIKGGVGDDPLHVSVVLSKFGIGDTRGICLGKCLASIRHLDCLGLSDNRLTALSIPTIIENVSYSTLLALDLSFNNLHETGAIALANYFKAKTVLQDMDLSHCHLTCSDIKILCNVLCFYNNRLEEWRMSCNAIAEDGIVDVCNFLTSVNCHVDVLDLSWNKIGEKGAITLSSFLPSNTSLSDLNLASNNIGDTGGQRIVKSLKHHKRMQKFNVSQNDIADGACFVVAQVLKGHKTLTNFDLTFNPLGEAGARSLFRGIMRGVTCWVFMGNCTFREDLRIFNCTYPSAGNPYTLDLTEPYKAAVLEELLIKYVEDPVNCSFENVTYRETLKGGPEIPIVLSVVNNKVVLKSTQEVWHPPEKGFVKFMFQEVVAKPTIKDALQDKYLDLLMKIVEAGKDSDRKKDNDKKRVWLYLLCQDVHLTTKQAQSMIDRFYRNETIGDGELTKLDVLKSVWKCLLDTENMFDFMYRNTSAEQRKDLVYALTLKRYKFNWSNPTAAWNLNLEEKTQRSIMMQIIAINNFESEFSKNASGRGDTSQQGNWYNFRNARYTINRETREILIDRDFVKNLPSTGSIEFDYVSTTRPLLGADNPVKLITDDELYVFFERLGLSPRKKITNAKSLFLLMDLQLASTSYYFTTENVHVMLDCFEDHWELQARVVIVMFSRIVDSHMIDVILRNLERRSQQEIMKRLGYLNVINPLKCSFDYVISLKYLDNRILLIALMELASMESADEIIEDPSTEFPIQAIYGAYTRTLNDTRPETMRFEFTDFGKRTKVVNWAARRDLVKKFLVGTTPVDDSVYNVIAMYKELEAEGKLTEGPIDLQHMNFQRQLKTPVHRASRNTVRMVNAMRTSKR